MVEQEQRVNLLFRNIEDEFSALERLDDTSRAESKLRTITGMLRDCKACAAHQTPAGGHHVLASVTCLACLFASSFEPCFA